MMQFKYDNSECTGCGACCNVCSTGAIHMVEEEGFLYPKFNFERCIECDKCTEICPVHKRGSFIEGAKSLPDAYAALANNEKLRMDCSSGGLFSLLAYSVLEKNGVVFGAKYSDNWNVVHTYIEHSENLKLLQRSKYVQSNMSDMFLRAEKFLNAGRFVLFSGLPCQIVGFKSFLGQDYKNLLCVDLSCHGVPSALLWKKYLNYRMKCAGSVEYPQTVIMHDKRKSWLRHELYMKFANGIEYSSSSDPYMIVFTGDVCLRESCYHCSYRGYSRPWADITLADFWGIDRFAPELHDDKGASLVIIHTAKGRQIFDRLCDKIVCKKVDLKQAILYNRGFSQQPNSSRRKLKVSILSLLQNEDFEVAYNKIKLKLFCTKVADRLKVFIKARQTYED